MPSDDARDDGRVIASMEALEARGGLGGSDGKLPGGSPLLSRRQLRHALFGALSASLLVAGILSLAIVLVVLFSTRVWLR